MRDGAKASGAWVPGWFWPSLSAPGALWLLALFVVPFFVILAVAFGRLDPIFLTPEPVYNPAQWQFDSFQRVLGQIFTGGTVFQAAFLRTLAYVAIAASLCLAVGYPVAYFIARHAGRFKAFFLVAFLAPFWVSYMMRMLAWINLLQEDGYVNRILTGLQVVPQPIAWLEAKPATVILGLVYGYIPYMILPLYATLDRIERSTIEAARDLGAGQVRAFVRVTLPLSRPGILAGLVLVSLPMFGDYYTQSLLSASRNTAMLGNLIVSSIQSTLVVEGAALVLMLMVLLIIPMLYYLRSTTRTREILGT
ncbi:MAG: ABC transporter permease [Actinomycetota bacterium]